VREAFERAILDNPDDLSAYGAYADWLQEQGDPRGEFIAVQIALEDEAKSKADRDALRKREAELLAAHEREWLGELAPFLLDGDREVGPHLEHRWRWGFLSAITVQDLPTAYAQAIATAPAARLLRELRMNWVQHDREPGDPEPRVPLPPGVRHHYDYLELIGAPCLHNLRVFQVGHEEPPEDSWTDCHVAAEGIEHVIATMPRIEELHLLCKDYESGPLFALPNLTHLRVLRIYHLGGFDRNRRYEIALDTLAANPALANLTHLLFHPHCAEAGDEDDRDRSYLPLDQVRALVRSPHLSSLTHLQLRLSDMGDEGVREIVASGILKRLRWLDLRHGCVTDEGAGLFAACPDARNLDRLDLSRNAVTAAGLAVLRAAGINAVASNPLTEQELASREYLREGDME